MRTYKGFEISTWGNLQGNFAHVSMDYTHEKKTGSLRGVKIFITKMLNLRVRETQNPGSTGLSFTKTTK